MTSSLTEKKIRGLTISDIHIGHHNTTADFIINNLDKYFLGYEGIKDVDVIFIAGDIFDRLLSFPSDDISHILAWSYRLLRLCEKYDIILRVLEGTPSHDWAQSSIFDTLMKCNNFKVDYEYVSVLSIEYIPKLDKHVLYVPDEWTSSTSTTLEQVKALLKYNNLTKVDLAIMHGMFEYQVPNNTNPEAKHSVEEYLAIVNEYIFIGHVHNFSTFSRIIAQGSFDRLCHGDEEPKGFVDFTLSPSGNSFSFIENKEAKIYKTIEVKTNNKEKELVKIRKILDKLPLDSFVRFKIRSDSELVNLVKELAGEYIYLHFSKVLSDKDKLVEHKTVEEISKETFVITSITRDNINSLVKNKLQGLTDDESKIVGSLTLMEEYL